MPKTKRRPAAKRSRKRYNKKNRRILLTIAVIAAAVLLALSLLLRGGGQITIAENALGSVLAPVQRAFTNATNWAVNFVENQRNYQDLSVEYAALKRENDSLKLEISSLQEDLQENKRLEGLGEAKDRFSSLNPVYGKVIARDPGVWFDTFSINVGENSGVKVNMAVVTGDGLVGRVYEVGLNYAKVLSIIDSRSAVACLVQRTRDNGVIRGVTTEAYDTASCYGYYLPSSSDAAVGDTVITSGMDTLFPKGIPIGTISAISRESESSENYVVITPFVDFTHIEEVMVLRTTVETDTDEKLPSLPSPTPKPTKEPTDLKLPSVEIVPTPVPESDDTIWYYPTATPSVPLDPSDSIEGQWANGTQN